MENNYNEGIMNLDDIYSQMNLLSHAYEESDYEIKYMHKQSDMLRERAESTVSGTIKTNLSKFHKKFILFICFFECQAPMSAQIP